MTSRTTPFVPDAGRMAKIQAVAPAIEKIGRAFVGVDAPPRIKLRDELKELFLKDSIVDRRRCKPSRMGAHVKNRFGQGILPARPHKLLSDIFGEGFSLDELDDPWAVATPPSSTAEYEAIFHTNQNICEMSSKLLPLYLDELEATSLTCTNTNQSCRIVLQGAPSDHEHLSENGVLSIERLRKKDPAYAQHCEDGLLWNIIPFEVEYLFPWVPDLFQEAGNTKQAYAEASTRFEVMLSVLKLAQRAADDRNAPAPHDAFWEKVQSEASRDGRVPFAEDIPHFVRFLKKLSGGIANPHYFNEYKSFLLTLKSKPKNIVGPIYSAVADVTVGIPDACPNFRIACMMAMSAASPTYSRGQEQILLDVNEIKTLSNKNAEHATNAEKMIVDAKAIAMEHKDEATEKSIKFAMYALMLRLVHHVFKKPDESRGKFDDMAAIGHAFVCDLVSIVKVPIHSPWSSAAGSANKSAPIAKKSANPGVSVFTTDDKVVCKCQCQCHGRLNSRVKPNKHLEQKQKYTQQHPITNAKTHKNITLVGGFGLIGTF